MRLKDEHKGHNHVLGEISPNLKAFNQELEKRFPEIRYTSGKRNASQKVGKFSAVSKHNIGEAEDIGAEHTHVYEWLTNDVEGLALLAKHGLGILDETNEATMKKTGATGKHYHIGTDSALVKQTQERYKKLSSSSEPIQKMPTDFPLELVGADGQPQLTYINLQDFKKEAEKIGEKENLKEKNIEENPEMQAIEQKRLERDQFLSAAVDLKGPVRQTFEEDASQQVQQSFRFNPQDLSVNQTQPLFSTGENQNV